MGKTVWMGIGMITASLLACQNEELEYYPIEKKHLGEAYTEYVDNNVQSESSGDYIVLNFYPEEITDLSYVTYNESSCSFHIYRGSTNKYVISWDYDTDGSYVEVQYMQNGFWYTINDQQHSGEYTLLANDGMGVRMRIQSGGKWMIVGEDLKYSIGVQFIASISVKPVMNNGIILFHYKFLCSFGRLSAFRCRSEVMRAAAFTKSKRPEWPKRSLERISLGNF